MRKSHISQNCDIKLLKLNIQRGDLLFYVWNIPNSYFREVLFPSASLINMDRVANHEISGFVFVRVISPACMWAAIFVVKSCNGEERVTWYLINMQPIKFLLTKKKLTCFYYILLTVLSFVQIVCQIWCCLWIGFRFVEVAQICVTYTKIDEKMLHGAKFSRHPISRRVSFKLEWQWWKGTKSVPLLTELKDRLRLAL